MSVADIFDEMESYNRRRQRDFKQEVINLFVLAESTAEHIGLYLSKDNTARRPWDFYPELFTEEKEQFEEEERRKTAEKIRESRKAYAEEIRRRREAGLM